MDEKDIEIDSSIGSNNKKSDNELSKDDYQLEDYVNNINTSASTVSTTNDRSNMTSTLTSESQNKSYS